MKLTIRHRNLFIRFGKIIAFTAAILVTTRLTLEFGTITSPSTAAFSFLILVLLSAFFGDLPVAITTSVVATLCYDYFYLPPFGTLNISAFSDWISLATFLLASAIISHLTAEASKDMAKAEILDRALKQLKKFGEWLLAMPDEKLTLSGIAKEAMHSFSLEYCSIHVYGDGKWKHFTGAAASDIFQEIEGQLKACQDHSRDLMDLVDENIWGVQYMKIKKETELLALLAVKSKAALPNDVLGAIAYMIGNRLDMVMKNELLSNRNAGQ